MHVHITCLTLESLVYKPVEERSTVVAESWRRVGVKPKPVLRSHRIGVGAPVDARADKGDKLMAPLVDDETANLTLVSLLPKAPNEVLAMTAECWVLEEPRDELMIFHLTNVLLFESSFSGPQP